MQNYNTHYQSLLILDDVDDDDDDDDDDGVVCSCPQQFTNFASDIM